MGLFLTRKSYKKVYIGGDSGYDTHFAEIGKQHPDIDLAILENGQYNESWKYIHTMPQTLERIIRELHTRKTITVHHSKYALSKHPWDEPLHNVKKIAETTALDIAMPTIGEVLVLDD